MGCNPVKDISSVIVVFPSNSLSVSRDVLNASCYKSVNTKKFEKEAAKKAEREIALVAQVMKLKNNIIDSNIKAKADLNKAIGPKAASWEELEKAMNNPKAKLLSLNNLDLSNNKAFQKFNYFLTKYSQLEEISIENCKIQALPMNLPLTLKILKCKENQIKEAQLLDLPNLVFLDLSYNQIEKFPENLSFQIQTLLLNNNQILDISDSAIIDLSSLQVLNISGNKISNLNFSLKSFFTLFTLNLNFNQIQKLPRKFFHRNSLLMNFYISNNPLSELHPRIGQLESLVKIDIRNTNIAQLPTTLLNLKNLEILLVSELQINFPPKWVVKQGLSKITEYLEENPKVYSEKDLNSSSEVEESVFDLSLYNFLLKRNSTVLKNSANFSQSSKRILDRDFYFKIKNWMDENSDKEFLCLWLKYFLCRSLLNEEPDTDKAMLAVNGVKVLFENYLNSEINPYEISATTPLFIARISAYTSTSEFLQQVGFKMSLKSHSGFVFTLQKAKFLKNTIKEYKILLENFIELFKVCRLKEQFLPDFKFI